MVTRVARGKRYGPFVHGTRPWDRLFTAAAFRPEENPPMAAETEIRTFLCRSDNIGVLIRDPATGACAAIDVPEADPVLRALDETGWRLTDILVTHRHADHVEGIPAVKQATGARVVAPAKAGDAVPQVDVTVREGDTVRVGGLTAQVWETPGHCADHVTYWFAQAGLVCAGDTLFTLGCGRVMESPPEILYRSLRRFADLPDSTQVFSGHDYVLANARFALAAEPDNAALKTRVAEAETAKAEGRFLVPSTMGAERATNPFLRCAVPALAKSVDLPPRSDPESVFVALRAWKNRF
jgi:hydroxyacylglutathione hydrolase